MCLLRCFYKRAPQVELHKSNLSTAEREHVNKSRQTFTRITITEPERVHQSQEIAKTLDGFSAGTQLKHVTTAR